MLGSAPSGDSAWDSLPPSAPAHLPVCTLSEIKKQIFKKIEANVSLIATKLNNSTKKTKIFRLNKNINSISNLCRSDIVIK